MYAQVSVVFTIDENHNKKCAELEGLVTMDTFIKHWTIGP